MVTLCLNLSKYATPMKNGNGPSEPACVYLWHKNYGQYRRAIAATVIRSDKSDEGGRVCDTCYVCW